MLRKKCWIHISETMGNYYGIEVSDRAVCLRTKDLIIKYFSRRVANLERVIVYLNLMN